MGTSGSRFRRPLFIASALSASTILLCLGAPIRSVNKAREASSGRIDNPRQAPSSPDLQALLEHAAEYCDRLSRTVLNFVCRESVEEWFYAMGRESWTAGGWPVVDDIERYRFGYDYQLTRNRAGLIQERRTLVEDQGKRVTVPNAPLKTHVFKHAYVVMGPLGLLKRDCQSEFDFRIVKDDKIGDEPAVVVEASPKPGAYPDCLFGTIWLRKADAGILKIQWNPASIGNYAGIETTARELNMKAAVLIISEYAYEKNGIRFPSRYTVKEIYLRKLGRHFERSETVVTYDRYKFFTVETEVKFWGRRGRENRSAGRER